MPPFTVILLGHGKLYSKTINSLEKKLLETVCRIISTKKNVRFLIGYGGEFKELCKIVLDRAIKILDSTQVTVEVLDNCSVQYKHIKGKMLKSKTEYLTYIKKCDLLIAYVHHREGAVYFTLEYAKSIGKQTINLTE